MSTSVTHLVQHMTRKLCHVALSRIGSTSSQFQFWENGDFSTITVAHLKLHEFAPWRQVRITQGCWPKHLVSPAQAM